jgi:c(7)-type cytochrome triheme protein
MATPASAARRSVVAPAALTVLVAALAAGAGLAGCSPETRSRVFVLLFEETPSSGENAGAASVVRSPRHPPPPTPTPTQPPAEVGQAGDGSGPAVFRTWDDVIRLLPKDSVGNPDWIRALEEKVIAPRPRVTSGAGEPEVLALNIDLRSRSDPAFMVIFSHQKHGEWLTCSNCHTGMFEMRAGATPMTAAEVHTDRYCAACHGKVAFDTVTGCFLCHLRTLPKDSNGLLDWSRAMAEKLIAPRAGLRATSVDEPTLNLDVELTPTAQPTLKGTFSHRTHTQWLACGNCHPRLFPKEASAPSLEGADLHSRRYCGACHGSVAFGIIGACGRCHPALEKARHHQEALDLDVEVTPKSEPSSKTIFSHKTHRFVECPSCHTDLYEMTAEGTKMTKADLYSGKYCALCHGKVAFDLITQCQRCHAPGDVQ